ncbi:MAG: hypothetical protein EHM41_13445 [Chloroflexi bacterium]|nr:MAG: hypothetical protein EHM41_13445 [Chloroflexota bacterium]
MLAHTFTLSIFFSAVRKEIVQQWRTKRFLVIMAVFLLFGLGSPMLVKIMPELIKSEPGGEELIKLLPPPSTTEAMSSYIDMIGSFGFLLAILSGMNAIAGEKESGTAGLILSKPMPRWAFILSKFTAQLLVYTAAFLMSGLAVYYCTFVLYGAVDIFILLKINLLLLLWFLTFVGATLLASTLGRTVATAGGVAFGFYLLISLIHNIPRVGKLAPDGLMAWAIELGTNAESVAVHTGAIAGTLALIMIFLIGSIVLFERQEIE